MASAPAAAPSAPPAPAPQRREQLQQQPGPRAEAQPDSRPLRKVFVSGVSDGGQRAGVAARRLRPSPRCARAPAAGACNGPRGPGAPRPHKHHPTPRSQPAPPPPGAAERPGGHLEFFRQARALGDHLTVSFASDAVLAHHKAGRRSSLPMAHKVRPGARRARGPP
jgi:hypothetical protein